MADSLLRSMVLAAVLAGLAACTVGPDYHRPPAILPASYKEATDDQGRHWKAGEPQLAASGTDWWSIYHDPVLDGLERQVEVSNQNLRAAEAAYRASRAVVAQARSAFFPTVTLNGSAQRVGQGSGQGSGGTVNRGTSGSRAGSQTQLDISVGASWELDVWGKIRRTVEGSTASAQASAADLASARLSAQALLAIDYFELRVEDELKRLLDATVAAFERSLQITRNQYAAGVAARSDVAQAEAQLDSTRAQAINVGVLRSQLEHAIAVLVGKPPADVSISPLPLVQPVPEIPPSVPSTLLERRPDIAAAERQVAAANAQIGVVIAAYYPSITLSGSYGFFGTALGGLLSASNSVWAVGPQLAQTLFAGGLRAAQVEQARATYDQTVANYRQTVLTGLQQVEDQLAASRILTQQVEVQNAAVKAAKEAEQLLLNQYKAGTVSYTSVITAQTAALADQETALTIFESRMVASVALIEALGGGWDASQLTRVD